MSPAGQTTPGWESPPEDTGYGGQSPSPFLFSLSAAHSTEPDILSTQDIYFSGQISEQIVKLYKYAILKC